MTCPAEPTRLRSDELCRDKKLSNPELQKMYEEACRLLGNDNNYVKMILTALRDEVARQSEQIKQLETVIKMFVHVQGIYIIDDEEIRILPKEKVEEILIKNGLIRRTNDDTE